MFDVLQEWNKFILSYVENPFAGIDRLETVKRKKNKKSEFGKK